MVPRLVADAEGRLQPRTLFRELCRRHPDRFEPGQLRTLQRRFREWRAQDGPDREVYFEQVAIPDVLVVERRYEGLVEELREQDSL